MCIAQAIKEVREGMNLTQTALGSMIDYSAKMVSAMETGRRKIPLEAKIKLAQLSPRLAIEVCSECPANHFNTDWLDGDVDLNTVVITMKMIEESSEFTDCLQSLNLINKHRPEQLEGDEKERIEATIMEFMDLNLGGRVWVTVMAQKFGINLEELKKKHRDKLIRSGYIKKPSMHTKRKSPVAAGL